MALFTGFSSCWRRRERPAVRRGTAEGGSGAGHRRGGTGHERERKEREKAIVGENKERVTLGPGEIRRVNGPHGNCCHRLNFDRNSKCGTVALP